jgi:hypothetical protein
MWPFHRGGPLICLNERGENKMPVENKHTRAELVERIRQARDLLDEALQFADGTSSETAADSTKTTARPSKGIADFSMPIRPYVKKYSPGMNGTQKFTLLVAYLCKGDERKTISLAVIEKEWGRMTELLGKFNGAHSGRARNDDLVATEKTGFYKLRPSWKTIFK